MGQRRWRSENRRLGLLDELPSVDVASQLLDVDI